MTLVIHLQVVNHYLEFVSYIMYLVKSESNIDNKIEGLECI
jgi:hypothetical protein